jgi:serine phosphatase RsbU (regulator of sigma subunit)
LLCWYHHQVCIHRLGWTFILHADGTTQARSPDGQILRSHGPPTAKAG